MRVPQTMSQVEMYRAAVTEAVMKLLPGDSDNSGYVLIVAIPFVIAAFFWPAAIGLITVIFILR